MSKYRDDVNDTAVASSTLWMRVRGVAESTARASNVILSGIFVMHVGAAVASDAVIDRVRPLTVESATVSDAVIDAARTRSLMVESARASDAVIGRTRQVLEDAARVSDAFAAGFRTVVVERVQVADEVLNRKHSALLTTEKARARDVLVSMARTLVQDGADASSQALDRVRVRGLALDAAAATDTVIDAHRAGVKVLTATARASSEAFGLLHARDVVSEGAVIEGEPVQFGDFGQAWTTNTGNWAMSRYAPFTFGSVVVIDGVAYAADASGVYALDGQEEAIAGVIRTGKLDMSGDVLVNLVEAHVEYELDGSSTMDVSQTQDTEQLPTYSYPLDQRATTALTNGRYQFGRGLSGRHFSFALHLDGKRGYINDWRVIVAPSKRSL